ncbi:uncharacterized protein LOC112087591 [Eutrema salsugineum]|uniref:uncharacterized protein LOC112087591 n=1 Tax=Eutrema salsugineum TaxID=72664 RepID=UPI000CECF88B|nr:uncharacterized protein LOC112087591 [Eutrema salsugineum]
MQDIKEMSNSIRELTDDFKKRQEILLSKANLYEEILLTKSDPQEEKESPEKNAVCCFDTKDALGNNDDTIFIKGFEYLRTREELKRLLSNIFGSCGEITRVYVPIECETRCPLGFAFINFKNGKDNDKALALNGCFFEGRKLEVTMGTKREEFYGFTNFIGCARCKYINLPRPSETGYQDW